MSVAIRPQLSPPAQSIFPLPLTTFESFMVADDRPDYPMICDVELQLQGRVDRAAFESAMAFALPRHPLFACRIERPRRGPPQWVPMDCPPPVKWVDLDSPLDESYGAFADLTAENPSRAWIRQGEERAKILLQFHHACSDGIGGLGFVEDLLAGYAMATPGAPPLTPRALDHRRLLRRGEAGFAGRSLWRRLSDTLVMPRESAKFFLKSPRPLAEVARQADKPPGPPARPGFIMLRCPENVSSALRRFASRAGVTANDVLLRDLFLVLRRWNATHDSEAGRHWLRILMPQNLRGRDDVPMPAANAMSFSFITQHSDLCDAPHKLLQAIHAETEAIRRGMQSIRFTKSLSALQSTRSLPWVLDRGLCFATAVMTNLSDPTRRFAAKFPRCEQGLVVGDLILDGLAGVAPLRPHTHASFSIVNSQRTASICLRWDPHRYTPADAHELLSLYVAQLQATAEGVRAGS